MAGGKKRISSWLGRDAAGHAMLPLSSADSKDGPDTQPEKSAFSMAAPHIAAAKPGRAQPRKWLHICMNGVDCQLSYIAVSLCRLLRGRALQSSSLLQRLKCLASVSAASPADALSSACSALCRVHGCPGSCKAWSVLQADKHTLVTELDIPYRDLRVLDPKVGRRAAGRALCTSRTEHAWGLPLQTNAASRAVSRQQRP